MEKSSINGESSGGFSVAAAMMEPEGISHRMQKGHDFKLKPGDIPYQPQGECRLGAPKANASWSCEPLDGSNSRPLGIACDSALHQ